MATTYSNAQLGIVDNSGNVKVVYPVTKATLVKMSTTRNSQTTVDGLLGTLGDCAYKNVSSIIDSGNTFDGTASYTSTTTTFNQKQIANLYSQLNSNKANTNHNHDSAYQAKGDYLKGYCGQYSITSVIDTTAYNYSKYYGMADVGQYLIIWRSPSSSTIKNLITYGQ